MPNTFTQIHIQFVFSVKYRAAVIDADWKNDLHKYITGIFQGKGHKMLQINSMPDHIHIFIGMRPTDSISDLMKVVKTESTKWINDNKFTTNKFAWQEGYGAFSYSKSHVNKVINYIKNQEEHHYKENFIEEYKKFLTAFEIDWAEEYIFKELE